MTSGLAACLAALAVATVIGLAWRASNGRMRSPRRTPARPRGRASAGIPAGPALTQDATHAALADGLPEAGPAGPAAPAGGLVVTPARVGQPLGDRATLLQFSSAFCAPCRATRRVLTEVAGLTDGVAHIEIDAESHLDLVRELGILRTPTVLVLDPGGQIVRRASGQPRKADVIGALGAAMDGPGSAGPTSYSPDPETRE